jgi:hypothetical protein
MKRAAEARVAANAEERDRIRREKEAQTEKIRLENEAY